MLDVTVPNLRLEVDAMVRAREAHTTMTDDILRQYTGSYYEEGRMPEVESHENHPFDFCVNTLPTLVFNNPKTNVKSRRPVVHRELTGSLRHGLNRWVKDVDLSDIAHEIAMDAMFDWGVALITLEETPGYEHLMAPPLRPYVSRISPRRFFMDHRALSPSTSRMAGHEWIADLDDLMDAKEIDPRTGKQRHIYNRRVLDKLTPDTEGDAVGVAGNSFIDDDTRRVPREQIRAYDIWIPEHGRIYTIARDAQGDTIGYLRAPRKFFGPRWGPYVIFGFYHVPDNVYPLPPLAVTSELVDELNSHIEQTSQQADHARQFAVVEGSDSVAVEAIKDARDGDILGIPGFDPRMMNTVDFGGPHAQQLEYIQRLRERLDRKSGLTDFARGNVTGNATATENQLAASSSDVRRKFMQQRFNRSMVRLLETAAWYMLESRNVVFPIATPREQQPRDPQEPFVVEFGAEEEMEDGVFYGGRYPGDDFVFEDLEIEIEPLSMPLQTEASTQQRLSQAISFLIANAQNMVAAPFLNWPEILDLLLDAYNIPDGRNLVNWPLLEQMIGVQLMGSPPLAAPGREGTPAPQPNQLKPGSGVEQTQNPAGTIAPGQVPEYSAGLALAGMGAGASNQAVA